MFKRYVGILLLSVFAQTAGAAAAGFYMENSMKASGKQPAERVTKVWLSTQKARFDVGDTQIIFRLDLNKEFIVRPKDKIYAERPLPASPLDSSELSVRETGTAKDINGYHAQEAIVTLKKDGVESTQKVFYTKDAGVPVDKFLDTIMQFPALQKAYEPFKKLHGIPVYSESTLPESNTTVVTELVKFEERSLDDNLFEIPADYKKH